MPITHIKLTYIITPTTSIEPMSKISKSNDNLGINTQFKKKKDKMFTLILHKKHGNDQYMPKI